MLNSLKLQVKATYRQAPKCLTHLKRVFQKYDTFLSIDKWLV